MIKKILASSLFLVMLRASTALATSTTLPTLSSCTGISSTDIFLMRHSTDAIDCKGGISTLAQTVYGVTPNAFGIPTSGSLPGTCSTGQLYFKTGVTGKMVYGCESANTWVLQGDGSAGGYVDPLTTKGDIVVFGSSTTRLPVGAAGTTPSANSNDSLGVTWQSPGYSIPGYVSSRWYTMLSGNAFTTGASSGGGTTAYVTPFYVSKRTTFTDIGVYTTAATGTKMHMAIYSGTITQGSTITLVAGSDVEDTSLSIGAMDSVTFSGAITLDKGWYGLEVFPNGAVTMNTIASGAMNFIEGQTDLNTAAPKLGASGQTYGALSSITLAIVNDASNPFAIGLKAQ